MSDAEINELEQKARLISDVVDEVGAYLENATSEVNFGQLDLDLADVMLGLLARQYQLWVGIVLGPSCWAVPVTPLVLRGLTDGLITLSWIALNPESAKNYKLYSAGQIKLHAEHVRQYTGDTRYADRLDEFASTELWTELLSVNVSNWNGRDIRTMATDADLKEVYDLSYRPLSAEAHAEWMSLRQHYLRLCDKTLHRSHWLPRFQRPFLRSDVPIAATGLFVRSAMTALEALLLTADGEYWSAVVSRVQEAASAKLAGLDTRDPKSEGT